MSEKRNARSWLFRAVLYFVLIEGSTLIFLSIRGYESGDWAHIGYSDAKNILVMLFIDHPVLFTLTALLVSVVAAMERRR